MDYPAFFQRLLRQLQAEKRYRFFRSIEKRADLFPQAVYHTPSGQERLVTLWCSNDYLGLNMCPHAIETFVQETQKVGLGSGGTRNIAGTNPLHGETERDLATFHHKESALVFTSGYVANEATLSTLAQLLPDVIVFSDAQNHASLISGIRYSRSEKRIFAHNNWRELETLLKAEKIERPKIIVAESIYSMDGDCVPLYELVHLAEAHNALLYLDEVHAVGLYGSQGGGLAQELGLEDRVPIIQGSLAKAIGTIGGYIASSTELIDVIRSYAPGFIFTTALPASLLAATRQNLRNIRTNPFLRTQHQERVALTKRLLRQADLPIMETSTHIIPLIIGDPCLCNEIAQALLCTWDIYLQPINYPTVPRGSERFRITPSSCHTPEMIEAFVTSCVDVWKQFGLYGASKRSFG